MQVETLLIESYVVFNKCGSEVLAD